MRSFSIRFLSQAVTFKPVPLAPRIASSAKIVGVIKLPGISPNLRAKFVQEAKIVPSLKAATTDLSLDLETKWILIVSSFLSLGLDFNSSKL